jgi:cell division protein FtsB
MLLWGGVGLVFTYLVVLLVFGRMGLVAHIRLSQEAARVDREIVQARTEIASLGHEVEDLNRDPHTIERLARERLGMVRPGETVFLFPPGPGTGAPDPQGGVAP